MVIVAYALGIAGIAVGLIFLWRFNVRCNRYCRGNPKVKSKADAEREPKGAGSGPSGAGGGSQLLGAIQSLGNVIIAILILLMGALLTIYTVLHNRLVDMSVTLAAFSGKFDRIIELLGDIKTILK